MGPAFAPFDEPLYVMAKPVGATCNLACDYCYYLDKSELYEDCSVHQMNPALLDDFIREYIASQSTPQVLFTWHGGEPLLRPVSFYRKVISLQRQYAAGHIIDNCIQTNGTLLTEEWCRFFKENNWLVGLSIDGPCEFHDAYRRDSHGKSSFVQVMNGIELLNRYGVQWNAMAVVNNLNAGHPLEFYRFFKSIGCRYIQFTPVVEKCRTGDAVAEFSVTPEQWGNFLCSIFDEWVRHDVGEYFIQIFDATLANWAGVQPGLCTMARTCGHAGVMEFNGDVYSCDHFVFPEYWLGNIRQKTLIEMMYGEKQLKFGRMKYDALPEQCLACDFLFACNGGCPKDRISRTGTGEPGLNYLCEGYHHYFQHVAPYMEYMKNEWLAHRSPSNVMKIV